MNDRFKALFTIHLISKQLSKKYKVRPHDGDMQI